MRKFDVRRMAILSVGLFGLVFAHAANANGIASAFDVGGLQLHFRADAGVIEDHFIADDPRVTEWKAQGESALSVILPESLAPYTSGTFKRDVLPVCVTNAFPRADGTFAPAVRFSNGNQGGGYLQTSTTSQDCFTSLNLESDVSVLFVARIAAGMSNRSLFGLNKQTTGSVLTRVGAFVVTSGDLRICTLENSSNNQITEEAYAGAAHVFCQRRKGAQVLLHNDGKRVKSSTSTRGDVYPDRFFVGRGFTLNGADADIGEIVILNRALNETERVIAETSLAVKYGLEQPVNGLWDGAVDGWTEEIIGVGADASDGTSASYSGAALQSGLCGGLRLELPTAPPTGAFILAGRTRGTPELRWNAHENAWFMSHDWKVCARNADGANVRLVFDFAALGLPETGRASGTLLRSTDGGETFAPVEATSAWDENSRTLAFTVGTMTDGIYRLRIESLTGDGTEPVTDARLMIWYRADAGIDTDENNTVTRWKNLGSGGATFDLCECTGTVTRVADAGNGLPAVRFDKGQISTATNAIFTQNSPETVFCVFRLPTDHTQESDRTLFGTECRFSRWGVFFPAMGNGSMARLFKGVYKSTGSDAHSCDIRLANEDAVQIIDTTALFNSETRAYVRLNLVWETLSVNSQRHPFGREQRIYLGRFNSNGWSSLEERGFIGDILELRVYDRELCETERLLVARRLAEHWKAEKPCPAVIGSRELVDGYSNDAVGVGVQRKEYGVPGIRRAGLSASGLSLTLASMPDDGNAHVTAAHDGAAHGWTLDDCGEAAAARWTRVWFIDNSTSGGGKGIGVTVSFDLSCTDSREGAYVLLRKDTPDGAWCAVAEAAATNGGTVVFDGSDGLFTTGWYTLGCRAANAAEISRPVARMPMFPGVDAGLTGWYRADQVTTLGNDVSAWPNLAASGSLLDANILENTAPTLNTSAFTRRDGSATAGIVFNGGRTRLKTTLPASFGSVDNFTYFAVFKNSTDAPDAGIFGSSDPACRFGLFFTGSHNLRCHQWFGNGTSRQIELAANYFTINTPCVVDACRSSCLNLNNSLLLVGNFMAAVDGLESSQLQTTNGIRAYSPLVLGSMAGVNSLKGTLAEVRVYDRALDATERAIVREHLAARYGGSLNSTRLYAGTMASAGCFADDVAGLGRAAAADESDLAAVGQGSYGVGTVQRSGSAGGLRVETQATLPSGTTMLFGHSTDTGDWVRGSFNMRRLARVWYLDARGDAESIPSRLTFSFAETGTRAMAEEMKPVYCLLRADDAETPIFADTGSAAIITAERVSFDVSGLTTGLYTLGCTVQPSTTIIIFR